MKKPKEQIGLEQISKISHWIKFASPLPSALRWARVIIMYPLKVSDMVFSSLTFMIRFIINEKEMSTTSHNTPKIFNNVKYIFKLTLRASPQG